MAECWHRILLTEFFSEGPSYDDEACEYLDNYEPSDLSDHNPWLHEESIVLGYEYAESPKTAIDKFAKSLGYNNADEWLHLYEISDEMIEVSAHECSAPELEPE